MHYAVTPKDAPFLELWQEKTVHVLSGGFNIQNFASFAVLGKLPKGIPLAVDFKNHTATPVKGVVLNSALGASDTTAQVKKNGLFAVGDFIGTGTKAVQITAINTDNAAYNVITLSEAIGAVANGGVLFSATEAGAGKVLAINALNYADVKYTPGVFACSAIIQAYEVNNSRLPYPLTTTQISQLGDRFFVY